MTIQILLLAGAVTYVLPRFLWNAHKTGVIKGRTTGKLYDRKKDGFAFYSMLVTCYVAVFVTYLAVVAVADIWLRYFNI